MQQHYTVMRKLNKIVSLITSLSEDVHFQTMDSVTKCKFKAELIDKITLLSNVTVNLSLHDEGYQSPPRKRKRLISKKYINSGFNDEDFHVMEPINDTEPNSLFFELLAAEKEAKLVEQKEESTSMTKLKQTQQDEEEGEEDIDLRQ